MPLLEIADIETMLQDTGGVPVSLGGVSTWGHLERTAVEVPGTDAYGTRIILVIATGALPELVLNATLAVGGATYTARDIVPVEDGSLTHVLLAED